MTNHRHHSIPRLTHPLHSAHHPFIFNSHHLHHPHPPPYHPHHSISATVSQTESHKIFESVNQAATAQIGQLRYLFFFFNIFFFCFCFLSCWSLIYLFILLFLFFIYFTYLFFWQRNIAKTVRRTRETNTGPDSSCGQRVGGEQSQATYSASASTPASIPASTPASWQEQWEEANASQK